MVRVRAAWRWEELPGAWLKVAEATAADWHQELDSALAVRRWERLQVSAIAGSHLELVRAKFEQGQKPQARAQCFRNGSMF